MLAALTNHDLFKARVASPGGALPGAWTPGTREGPVRPQAGPPRALLGLLMHGFWAGRKTAYFKRVWAAPAAQTPKIQRLPASQKTMYQSLQTAKRLKLHGAMLFFPKRVAAAISIQGQPLTRRLIC